MDFYRYQDKITTFTNPELAEGEGFTTVKTSTNRVSLHLSQQSNPIVGCRWEALQQRVVADGHQYALMCVSRQPQRPAPETRLIYLHQEKSNNDNNNNNNKLTKFQRFRQFQRR